MAALDVVANLRAHLNIPLIGRWGSFHRRRSTIIGSRRRQSSRQLAAVARPTLIQELSSAFDANVP